MSKSILLSAVLSFSFFTYANQANSKVLLTCMETTTQSQPVQLDLIKSEGQIYITSSLNEYPIPMRRSSLNSYESKSEETNALFLRVENLNFTLEMDGRSYLFECRLGDGL